MSNSEKNDFFPNIYLVIIFPNLAVKPGRKVIGTANNHALSRYAQQTNQDIDRIAALARAFLSGTRMRIRTEIDFKRNLLATPTGVDPLKH